MRATTMLVALVALLAAAANAMSATPSAKATTSTSTVQLVTAVVAAKDSGRFDFKVRSTRYTNGGDGYGNADTTGSIPIDPTHRSVSVTESAHPGTKLGDYATSYVCTKNGVAYKHGHGRKVSVAVGRADVVVCTFTNLRKAGSLRIAKVVSNPDGAALPAQYAVTYDCGGAQTGQVSVAPGAPVTVAGIPARSICTVRETAPDPIPFFDWSAPTYSPAKVTIADRKTSTITVGNTIRRDAGTIELRAAWLGSAPDVPMATTLSIGSSAGGSDIATKLVSSDDTTGAKLVVPGTYYVAETPVSGYTSTLSCADAGGHAVAVGPLGNVAVARSAAVVCRFTNRLDAVRPVANDCSGGTVAFTFDDGPSENSEPLLAKLQALNLKATFFVIGQSLGDSFGSGTTAVTGSAIVADEIAAGHTVGNHTWDHASFTGASTGIAPLSDSAATDELVQAAQAIAAAGGVYPTLYRPPYGDINDYYDLLARKLGFRVVMSYGTAYDSAAGDGNIVDSNDYDPEMTPASIASRIVDGYSRTINGVTYHWHGIQADSIVAMHDGSGPEAQDTIDSLQAIVDVMNQRHLCSTATIRPDATGNIVTPPPPAPPSVGNLLENPGLENLPSGAGTGSEPVCWQHAGYGSNSTVWTLTADAHSGSVAQRVDVSNWASGDAKIVPTQRASQASCLAPATPGKTYQLWAWYKGDWASQGAGAAAVSMATFYRNASGAWVYWQGSPWVPPTATWNLAYFRTGPLPAGATAISWGLALRGNGSLTTDDYTMVEGG